MGMWMRCDWWEWNVDTKVKREKEEKKRVENGIDQPRYEECTKNIQNFGQIVRRWEKKGCVLLKE